MRIIFYNIEYLEGATGKKYEYLELWKRLIPPKNIQKNIVKELKKHNPDIVSLVEIGGDFISSEKKHVNYFKKNLKMKYHMDRIKYNFKKISLFKYIPIFNSQSNAVFSKIKIRKSKVYFLKKGMKRTVLRVDLEKPNIALIVVHLALGKKTRQSQISELIKIIKKIKKPVVLMGDFNTFGGEKEIKKLLKETHMKHKFRLTNNQTYTFPSFHPKKRFDYVITSKEIKVKKYKVLKIKYSDHLPLLVDIEVKDKK
ncbi:hypothetical protein GOV12_05085 [Candidatus Pacearchaeota archaeon]|nr:hypothetical protein [Candidatus Pacearchaeota archaeon]